MQFEWFESVVFSSFLMLIKDIFGSTICFLFFLFNCLFSWQLQVFLPKRNRLYGAINRRVREHLPHSYFAWWELYGFSLQRVHTFWSNFLLQLPPPALHVIFLKLVSENVTCMQSPMDDRLNQTLFLRKEEAILSSAPG